MNLQSRKIAEQTHQQTRQTYRQTEHARTESVALKMIAVMTMMFLPATLVTGLFGTNLFYMSDPSSDSEGNAQLLVSPQLWILFAIVIPLTALTYVAWLVGNKIQAKGIKGMDDRGDGGV